MTPGAKLNHLGLWLFAWLLLAGQALAAQSVLDVTQVNQEAVSLTGYFAVLEDPSATLTLADVSQPGFSERFQSGQATGQALGFGFTRSAIWLRLHLKNPSDQPVESVLEIGYTLLASVDFYQPAGPGYQRIEVGYLRPPSARALTSRFIALSVSLPAGADQQLFLRVQTPNSLNIPATLWSSEAFHAREPSAYALQALYFGIVLALGVYNLMLFLALREVNYLLYVLVTLGVALGLATFTGMGSTFGWGFAPYWTKIGVNVPTALASVALLILARRLLGTLQLVPRLDPWLKRCMAANAAFALLLIGWFQEVNPYFIVLSLVTALLIWVTAVVCVARGERSAYYFVAAFSVLLLANVATHLRNLGLASTNFFTRDGLQLGSAIEMLLLSLAALTHVPDAALRATQFTGHVLVVEDNDINQTVIKTLLAKHGVQVTLVGDGQQALDALTVDQPVKPFDLVLMDLQMPVLDGYGATRQLRAWEAQTGRARLPVVALTAGAFEDDRQQCLDAGMDDVQTKPVVMSQLQATLARWLPLQPTSVAAQDSAPAPQHKRVDVAHIRALLADIRPLLAGNKFASIACCRQLQEALAGTELADEMAQTARLLQEFRFDLVQQRLRQLAARQGWDTS